ncbi:MarR family winged helix-turn-helix transcriptional regulator [Microlunatus flavus]|uniref:DNA-binding transcriptional regulator, MarR family n=1 Tax=Microlunatus flavus TaxID=1036181 RepID=A0A1H9HMY6_9ACTN|nr:MarR family transcriptional regulator [Microlunatus flavus]SEQ63658.1 DNA-binding transcriptional regulator, MarR family [Microlunatus flavus]
MTQEATSEQATSGEAATGKAPRAVPPAPSVSVLLIGLGRRAREGVEARLAELGLAYHHLSALGHLRRQAGLSYSELARRASVTTQSMQTTVAHLERRGLVDRGAATSQGRRADLQVTERGAAVLAEAEAALRVVDDSLVAGLDPAAREQLEQTLVRLFAGSAGRGEPGPPAGQPTASTR